MDHALTLAREAVAHGAIQKTLELAELVGLLEQRALRTVVEIGTERGGTLQLWCRIAQPDAVVVSIDLPGGPFGGGYSADDLERLQGFAQDRQALHLIRADSHKQETKRRLEQILGGRPVDFLFIDGDHAYSGARKDWEMYASLVAADGLVAFHDIVVHPQVPACEVHRLWQEIRPRFRHREIVVRGDDRGWGEWGGIGVVWPAESSAGHAAIDEQRAPAGQPLTEETVLDLRRVSLVAADSVFTAQTVRAMKHCLAHAEFRNAFVFTSQPVEVPGEIGRYEIPPLASREAYSRFMVRELPRHRELFGDYVLVVQYDGFILDPRRWRDEFFDFDYIGAVWPEGDVGNGGFSLRSQKLLECLGRVGPELGEEHPEDGVICRTLRSRLESEGIVFAPRAIAHSFSNELVGEADESFGYHGTRIQALRTFSVRNTRLDAQDFFNQARFTPSDICEHMDTLRRLAAECEHVTEFAKGYRVSTAAFVYAAPQRLVVYDSCPQHSPERIEPLALEQGIQFEIRTEDVLDARIEETDLLFIDTVHTYERCAAELRRHAARVRRYLVFHDTTTFGQQGEHPGSVGIWPAIVEFLAENPRWRLLARYENNNGLTVLARGG